MSRIRIFVSYDSENDADLHDRLEAQSMRAGSSFELTSHPAGGSMTDTWIANCRARIRAVDEMVVICGEHTNASSHVALELSIAQEEGVPYLLLWGRREVLCTKPAGARPNDAMYSWSRDILESQMSITLRNSKPIAVPESCKRH